MVGAVVAGVSALGISLISLFMFRAIEGGPSSVFAVSEIRSDLVSCTTAEVSDKEIYFVSCGGFF